MAFGTSEPIAEEKPASPPPGRQTHVGGQLGAGGIDPSDDLGRAVSKQAAGPGQPDAPHDPLPAATVRRSATARGTVARRQQRPGTRRAPRRCCPISRECGNRPQ
jgi:hypothetical protein